MEKRDLKEEVGGKWMVKNSLTVFTALSQSTPAVVVIVGYFQRSMKNKHNG